MPHEEDTQSHGPETGPAEPGPKNSSPADPGPLVASEPPPDIAVTVASAVAPEPGIVQAELHDGFLVVGLEDCSVSSRPLCSSQAVRLAV